MYVANEIEIFGNKSDLKFFYDFFKFKNIKKPPNKIFYNNEYEYKQWCLNNWGTDEEMKILNKNFVWDNLEKKLSILFITTYVPLKIINYFALKNPYLKIKLYYYDYYNLKNGELKWENGILEYNFVQNIN
jgi:hypothetical protein